MRSRSLTAAPQSGFTLLEVLVAIALLAFLSIGIQQATTSAWTTNAKLSSEATDMTTILLSLQAVESDLAQIYTPLLGPAAAPAGSEAKEFWSVSLRSDGMRRTRFKGTGEKVTFVANNNRRVEADTPQSDFQRIWWEVERNAKGTYSLYRSVDWDAFRYEDDHSKKPERVALLENLSSAKFQFYRLSDKQWVDEWDSENSYAKEETRFPSLIRLKVEAPDPTNAATTQAWEIVVRPNRQLNYYDAAFRKQLKERFE